MFVPGNKGKGMNDRVRGLEDRGVNSSKTIAKIYLGFLALGKRERLGWGGGTEEQE